jgi:hypothetical protein
MKVAVHVNKSDNGPPLVNPEIYKIHFLSDASFKITQQICEPERTTNNIVTKMVDIKSGNLLVEKYVKGGIIDSATRIS